MKTVFGSGDRAAVGKANRYVTSESGGLCRPFAMRAAIFGFAILTSLCGGCASINQGCACFNHSSSTSCKDVLFCGWRDHVWAKRAYHQRFATCGDRHPSHFRRGFLAGYSAVCDGEDGYAPAVPPKDYWGYSYQSAEGNEMVTSWFGGYPEGVRAATDDGSGMYRDVQVSSMLNAAMQPSTDAWAPYVSTESGSNPPVLSGQEIDLPPLPAGYSTPPETIMNQTDFPTNDTTHNYRQPAARTADNTPLSVPGPLSSK